MASGSRRRIIFPDAAVTMAERATSIRHNDPLEDTIDRGIRLEHRTGKWNPLFGKADAQITARSHFAPAGCTIWPLSPWRRPARFPFPSKFGCRLAAPSSRHDARRFHNAHGASIAPNIAGRRCGNEACDFGSTMKNTVQHQQAKAQRAAAAARRTPPPKSPPDWMPQPCGLSREELREIVAQIMG